MLSGLAAQIEAGKAPATLVTATHSLPSIQFATFGFDRSRATNHNVACAMFFMAAIAERAGNGTGGGNPRTAHNLLVVAQSEVMLAQGHKPTMKQHVKRGEEEAKQVSAKPLTGEESAAIINAVGTLPLKM